MTDGEYARVYHAIVDDTKFADVYDNDAALATWLRLLIIADQAYPASAILPGNAKHRVVKLLADVGLVDLLPGWRYRIHGLDAERSARSESARKAAAKRWHSGSNATASDSEMPSRARARAEQEQSTPRALDGWPNLTPEAIAALEDRTGSPWSLAGDKQLLEYDRLIGAHGLVRVVGAFDAVRDGKRMTARQLVWPAVKLLEPFPDPKQSASDSRERAEQDAGRRRVEATLRRTHEFGAHDDSPHPQCPVCRGEMNAA